MKKSTDKKHPLRRPAGIIFFGIMLIILAISSLAYLIYAKAILKSPQLSDGAAFIAVIIIWAYILCGVGLLYLRDSTRKLTIALMAFSIVITLIEIFAPLFKGAGVLSYSMAELRVYLFIWLVFYGLAIWYFVQPRVKAAFANRTLFFPDKTERKRQT